ncbi:MAG: hypothetical protein ACE5NM_01915 [Sedimentisphaerales bacterium]
MKTNHERRIEQRLRYHWPIWFAEDFDEELAQGQMVNISSRAAAFTCYTDGSCPYPGQQIIARFSVPRYGPDNSFDMANFTRSGHICRVDDVNSFLRRVAIQFAEPLPFRPGEQSYSESHAQAALKPMTT